MINQSNKETKECQHIDIRNLCIILTYRSHERVSALTFWPLATESVLQHHLPPRALGERAHAPVVQRRRTDSAAAGSNDCDVLVMRELRPLVPGEARKR